MVDCSHRAGPRLGALLLACSVLPGLASAAASQEIPGCTRARLADPPRIVYRCRAGLVIEAEASADIRAAAASPNGTLRAVAVDAKAVLVDLPPRRGAFQILTPVAIASVRGTTYAVDVSRGRTSVFVVEGRVRVARRSGTGAVELGPGQGVDVVPGRSLEVRRWPKPRAGALLARFGR